jgi:RHS repeat-associated protein
VLVDKPDATGTYYRRNRSYDPNTGRFTQEDPIGLAGGLNLYGFANGDPVNATDPFGLCPDPKDPRCTDLPIENELTNRKIIEYSAAIATFFTGGALSRVVNRLVDAIVGKDPHSQPVSESSGAGTWGNSQTLEDHFVRHGGDFSATSAEDYANQAGEFYRQARANGLPSKVDANGVIRIYDPETNTFGAYNSDGTTRTFFKPSSGARYWEKQPGGPPPGGGN